MCCNDDNDDGDDDDDDNNNNNNNIQIIKIKLYLDHEAPNGVSVVN